MENLYKGSCSQSKANAENAYDWFDDTNGNV